MEMQESQTQSQRDGNGSIEDQLAQANLPVAKPRHEMESNTGELPDGKKSVKSCVQQ